MINRVWVAGKDEMGGEVADQRTDQADRQSEMASQPEVGGSSISSATAQALRHELRSPLVMLVDDDPATGFMYEVGLNVLGFRVIVLNDVSAMFVELENEVPDVVVLDFHLGGVITGVDVLENLRLDHRTSHVPAFILSNHLGDLDGQIDRAFAAGASAWLVKSKVSPADLGVRISQTLASK